MELINDTRNLKAHQIAVFWMITLHCYPFGEMRGITEAELCRLFSHDPKMTRHKVRHSLATLLTQQKIIKLPPNKYAPSLFTISTFRRFILDPKHQDPAQNAPWLNTDNANEDEALQERADKKKSNHDIKLNSNISSKRAKSFTDEDLSFVTKIWNTLKVRNNRYRAPNLKKWADTVRLMREQDDLTHQDIDSAFTWVLEHTFWQTVIQSPDSLRKHWNKIAAQMPANSLHQSANVTGKSRELKVVL